MSKFIKCILFTLALFISSNQAHAKENYYKIAIIMPMNHHAMNDIVDGFKEYLENEIKGEYKLTIYNAQGDPNLMKTIFQQVSNNNYDAVVPIGTNATQLAIKMLKKDKNVVSIAAELSEEDKAKNANLTNVEDAVPMEEFVEFIKTFILKPKYLTLIHSNDTRIFNQSKSLDRLLKDIGCNLQVISIQNMPEIFSALQSVSEKSQAILVLKDHLVVSAIPSIVNVARKNNISVIASDEGSVKNGADVALGVKEKELGIIGAKIVVSQIVKSDKINNKFDSNPNLIIFKNKISLLKPLKNALYDQELIVKG
ncbi:MAG: ABC transporter substrate-binding protein [Candidatus Midichloriaceae bacterium]